MLINRTSIGHISGKWFSKDVLDRLTMKLISWLNGSALIKASGFTIEAEWLSVLRNSEQY